eukprot:jgi/Hompol1/3255/HPOL_003179-RA
MSMFVKPDEIKSKLSGIIRKLDLPSRRVSNIKANLTTRQATQMIEHAEFLYDQSHPMLPNGVSTRTHLLNAIEANTDLTPNLYKKWKFYLLTDASQNLIADASVMYVNLFLRFKGDDKDEFFQTLPELYAQAVYTALREAYSQSFKYFEQDFQTKLCDDLFHLLSGITPFNPSCSHWPIEIVQSRIGRRAEDAESEAVTQRMAQRRATTFGRDAVMPKQGQGDHLDVLKTNSKQIPSSYIGASIQTKRVNFNIYQNSPIVDQYLKSLGVSRDQRTVVIESTKQSKRSFKLYRQAQEEAIRERNRVVQETSAHLMEEQRRTLKILSRPQEVKNVADQILEHYSSREASRRDRRKPEGSLGYIKPSGTSSGTGPNSGQSTGVMVE